MNVVPNQIGSLDAGSPFCLHISGQWPGASDLLRSAMLALRLSLYSSLIVLLSGCAAIGTRDNNGAGKPYAGVRENAYYLAHPSEADMPALQPLNVLDMPFSFVVDTLCLPYDLVKPKPNNPAAANRRPGST